ncbi:aminodeoxychorismate synthase component I [Trichlorobacter sp.]|uniref:aminodeoxychorismate synthase component I n=1 Tax=Trichlorobacter sp. TaxID=2911007 RepID=UPI002A363FEB|nr:aminodeoxychorismate synthase component I [Trichlorobacter sp.]MDY0384192.1 aminodeoxychorismate synthase component I [Trichlorobacter sp.]
MNTPHLRLDGWGAPHGTSWLFDSHRTTLAAFNPAQVPMVLRQAEAAAAAGCYAVGFVAYEAAAALNPHLPALPPLPGLPLAWFAIYGARHACPPAQHPSPNRPLPLQPRLTAEQYSHAISALHDAIAAGESYQVNYTFPLTGRCHGNPLSLYQAMLDNQRPPFGALLDTGNHLILSASPELFFQRQGQRIVTRPMKGTALRGRFPAEDAAQAAALAASPKEQAENLMIVDLLRNDLGQIAQTGSVQVEQLFALEHYPTVHQLTSTVSASLLPRTDLEAIFRALFPCGSVTGAPKRRSMELIARHEARPRGVYCGAIGLLEPGGDAIFSVAIRTLLLDRQTSSCSMGVGSGITWDAKTDAEYAECHAKAAFLNMQPPPRLLESLRLENGHYPLLERHLTRLAWSAGRLGHHYNAELIEQRLLEHAANRPGIHKVRLLLAADGELEITSAPIEPDSAPLRLALSSRTIDPDDQSLYLKTETRQRYDAARQEQPAADEVLLVNRQGQLTEGSYHNLVLRLDGRLMTPPLTCGLLPGVMREELLAQGTIHEQMLYPADLGQAEEIWLINAVRGWRCAQLLHDVS